MLEHLWVIKNHIIFPVWHNITLEEVRAFRVWLANIIGLSTDSYTIAEITDEIHEAILAYYALQQEFETDG